MKIKDNAFDYTDAFELPISVHLAKQDIQAFGKAFFTSAPKWVEGLMELRDVAVSVFGLKISEKKANRKKMLDAFSCQVGEELGVFKVFESNKEQVVLGQDDSHLNFRIAMSINQKENTLVLETKVKFNNNLGRFYFVPVKPFHKIIVPKVMKGMIKEVSKN